MAEYGDKAEQTVGYSDLKASPRGPRERDHSPDAARFAPVEI